MKRPPVFLRNGGSCLSTIVLTISLMHGSILPVTIPPGQPPGRVQPFGPGGGELFEAVLSRG